MVESSLLFSRAHLCTLGEAGGEGAFSRAHFCTLGEAGGEGAFSRDHLCNFGEAGGEGALKEYVEAELGFGVTSRFTVGGLGSLR